MMPFFVVAFIAGALTVMAPCMIPVLPIILGGSALEKSKWRPVIITLSLSLAVILFTLILKFSTALIGVSPRFWQILSGSIVIFFGLFSLFPNVWSRISGALRLSSTSEGFLSRFAGQQNFLSTVLVGFALGPVFASCSPTYFVILGVVLPANFLQGLIYLSIYSLGLAAVLLPIAYLGQYFIEKMRWAVDPRGWFKKFIGVLFILVGLMVATGYEKKIETFLLDRGSYDFFGNLEEQFAESARLELQSEEIEVADYYR